MPPETCRGSVDAWILDIVIGNPRTMVRGSGMMVRDPGTVGDDSSGPMSRKPHTAELFPVGDTSLSPGLVRSTTPGGGPQHTTLSCKDCFRGPSIMVAHRSTITGCGKEP